MSLLMICSTSSRVSASTIFRLSMAGSSNAAYDSTYHDTAIDLHRLSLFNWLIQACSTHNYKTFLDVWLDGFEMLSGDVSSFSTFSSISSYCFDVRSHFHALLKLACTVWQYTHPLLLAHGVSCSREASSYSRIEVKGLD